MKAIGYIATILFLILIQSVVFTFLWSWFIVPFGAPELGYAHAYGLIVIYSFLKPKNIDKEKPKQFGDMLVQGFSNSLVCLVFGYITHLFM